MPQVLMPAAGDLAAGVTVACLAPSSRSRHERDDRVELFALMCDCVLVRSTQVEKLAAACQRAGMRSMLAQVPGLGRGVQS